MSAILDYRISENFLSSEFCVSSDHPDLVRDVPEELRPQLHRLALELQKVRGRVGILSILSGYRAEVLNAAVGGSKTSQHLRAEAADVYAANMSPRQLFNFLRKNRDDYSFGQIISYPGFVHVALANKKYKKPTFFSVVGGELQWVN